MPGMMGLIYAATVGSVSLVAAGVSAKIGVDVIEKCDSSTFFKGFLVAALGEALAIYGFVISIMFIIS